MIRALTELLMLTSEDRRLLAHAWIRAHGWHAKWYNASWVEFLRVIDAYSEPHRVYHTVRHLVHGLKARLQYRSERYACRDPIHFGADSSELLAWFYHDFVYVIGGKDNETFSAAEMRNYALGRLPLRDIEWAEKHIAYTADHFNHMSSKTVQMDLAILWGPRDEYLDYVDAIEDEYRQKFTSEQYATGRMAFLRKCLEYFDDPYNYAPHTTSAAIDNITFEIENVLYDR